MGTYKDIQKGTRALKRAKFRLATAPGSDESPIVELGLLVLSDTETIKAEAAAEKQAREEGAERFDEGDRVYARCLHAHTVAAAAVDLDDPDQPFFAADPKDPKQAGMTPVQVLQSDPLIGSDTIANLYDQQQRFVDECSVLVKTMTPEEITAWALRAVSSEPDDTSFLDELRPGLHATLLRILANLWLSSLTPKSPSGSDSEQATNSPRTKTASRGQSARKRSPSRKGKR